MSNNALLSFEYQNDLEKLFVLGNEQALQYLSWMFHFPNQEPDHHHLLVPEDLNTQPQRENAQAVYCVTTILSQEAQVIKDQQNLERLVVFEYLPQGEPGGGVDITVDAEGAEWFKTQLHQVLQTRQNLQMKSPKRGGQALTLHCFSSHSIPIEEVEIVFCETALGQR